MATPPQGARNKASKLRKALAAGTIGDIDRLWLADYEEKTNGSGSWGASASKTKVHRTETVEEEKAAVGTGTAAANAASLALATREEGRRLDSLFDNIVNQQKQVIADYREIFVLMKGWMEMRETKHIEMLEVVRQSTLALADAEADLIEKDREKKPDAFEGIADAIVPIIARRMGLAEDAPAPKKNGAAKR